MKNMDYEKKYNEALNWMRELYPGLHGATKEDAEHYFPELKESEESKDERIRKAIVELIKRTPSSMFDADTVGKWIGASHDEILAYIEKQKEQNSEDEEYSDFTIYHPLKNGKGNYECIPYSFYGSLTSFSEDKDLIDFLRTCFYTEEECNEWIKQQKEQKPITINQDEKEFLADEITAFLCNYDKEFDGEDPVPSEVAEHFYLLGKQAQEQKPSINIDQLKSLMLQYLQEASNEKDDSAIEADTNKWARKILGYDFEQKPTEDWREKRKEECPFRRNLDNNLYGCERYADVISECTGACSWVVDYPKLKEIQDKKEQKSAEWSEEDKAIIGCIVCCLDGQFVTDAARKQCLEWFNKHRRDFLNQPKQEWSEEDENKLNHILEIVHIASGREVSVDEKEELESFLKSLRPQPKQEWSEEDEEMLTKLLDSISIGNNYKEMRNWLLLKLKSLSPQPKQEQEPEAKLTGWVARDSKYNSYFGLGLVLFKGKPRRSGECWSGAIAAQLPWELFPDLKWEDEPLEVEIIIRKK